MSLETLWRGLFKLACVIGRPIGGLRPRRMYDSLGRRAYPRAEYRWVRNVWGDWLRLSPHYHIDRNIIAFGTYDRPLHEAMERLIKPGMVCLDVGANLGEMALHMARLAGQAGQVHAFEPVPHVFERLAGHVERNAAAVRCHRLALSDRDGQAEIFSPHPDSDNQGLGSLVHQARPEHQRIVVPTCRLDSFVQRENLACVDFIKLDIEGAEPLFLDGAEQTLRRCHPVMATEVMGRKASGNVAGGRPLCERIVALGYRLYRLGSHGPGREIPLSRIGPDFHATSVLCIP